MWKGISEIGRLSLESFCRLHQNLNSQLLEFQIFQKPLIWYENGVFSRES